MTVPSPRTRGPRRGLPTTMAALTAVAVAFLVLPLVALAGRVPWGRTVAVLADPAVPSALRLSLIASLASLALATLLGVPLGWVLARTTFPGKALVRALAVLPMVLPPVVAGVALLLAFGRRGLVGRPLAEIAGITIPFSLAAVVIAGAFVSMPFLVISVEAGLRAADERFEEAAATLGASRWYTFRHVTLPLIAPSLGAGMALCWTRALGEFGATITFAGNLPGRTQTMPLAVHLQLEADPDVAYLLSFVLLLASVAVLLALRGRPLRVR